MPVTHVNRKRDTYYLHAGTTKTGKPRYWFSMKDDGDRPDRADVTGACIALVGVCVMMYWRRR